MVYTVYDVTSGVYIRLGTSNIPTSLTVDNISDLANDRINQLNQNFGITINSGNIAITYLSPLRDLTTADVLAHRNNTDIDTQISVGNISLNYSNKQVANSWQVQFYLDRAQSTLNMLGRRILSLYTTKAN